MHPTLDLPYIHCGHFFTKRLQTAAEEVGPLHPEEAWNAKMLLAQLPLMGLFELHRKAGCFDCLVEITIHEKLPLN